MWLISPLWSIITVFSFWWFNYTTFFFFFLRVDKLIKQLSLLTLPTLSMLLALFWILCVLYHLFNSFLLQKQNELSSEFLTERAHRLHTYLRAVQVPYPLSLLLQSMTRDITHISPDYLCTSGQTDFQGTIKKIRCYGDRQCNHHVRIPPPGTSRGDWVSSPPPQPVPVYMYDRCSGNLSIIILAISFTSTCASPCTSS